MPSTAEAPETSLLRDYVERDGVASMTVAGSQALGSAPMQRTRYFDSTR